MLLHLPYEAMMVHTILIIMVQKRFTVYHLALLRKIVQIPCSSVQIKLLMRLPLAVEVEDQARNFAAIMARTLLPTTSGTVHNIPQSPFAHLRTLRISQTR